MISLISGNPDNIILCADGRWAPKAGIDGVEGIAKARNGRWDVKGFMTDGIDNRARGEIRI